MVCRIEVGSKPGFPDPAGAALQKRIESELGLKSVRAVRVIDVYTMDSEFSGEELERIGAGLFTDVVTQQFSIGKPLFDSSKFSFSIMVGFRAGVKDNAGDASKEAIEGLLSKRLQGSVYTSKNYLISGSLSKADAQRVARELLANELIQRFEVKSASEFGCDGFGSAVPKVQIAGGGLVGEIDLEVPDRRLLEISKSRVLSLSLAEMKAIREHYSDPHTASERKKAGLPPCPTDVELEAIAQTWSEHCKHKIFNAKISFAAGKSKKKINSLFSTYIKSATKKLYLSKKWLVSVFSDNAGIFEFVPGWNVAMKVETHNTPSALDPFGGALTGILGVNRDILGCGLGAKPILNTDVFCFADPCYQGEIPPRLFHPRRVLEGVRSGVAHGGNASGIPTINGALVFDGRYLGKPLVYCGTGGLMPSEINGRKTHEKRASPGDRIFMAGGRIGKDGIHGATFSSVELHEGSPVSAVQLGDPYTQKKLQDFLIEARDKSLYNAVTDNGAGGLSSSVCEMAESSGGCILHLDRAPLKYPGLDPWEILLSESQERMTFSVPPSRAGEFVSLARLRGVEVSDLGEFNQSGFVHVKYGAKSVAYLEMAFLHHGLPQLELEAELKAQKPRKAPKAKADAAARQPYGAPRDFSPELLSLLSRPNICSKEYIIRQYDHEVQGSSVVKPLCGVSADGPSDAGVIAPLLGRKEGLVVSNGICPRYSDLDCYQMAANALDEAVRNYVAAGGSL
ncbi:MAG: phosphoribosylformylglycinamidine synthase subunit PurS, partial [Candidatus Micrarchaeia archaeon]